MGTAVIKMSLSRAWIFVRNVFKNITVEPIIFLYVINACTYQIVFQNLQIEKACKVNLNHTADVCDNLKDPANEDVQNEVRILVPILISQMMMYRMREDSCLCEGFLLLLM